MAGAPEAVDARADRAVQGAIAIFLLTAFVFHQAWVTPVLTVLVAFGAAFGPAGNPFHRLFSGVVAPRISAPTRREAASTVRAQDALAAGLLAFATVWVLIGLGGIAWVIALVEAGVAVVAATTGVHVGDLVLDRIHRR